MSKLIPIEIPDFVKKLDNEQLKNKLNSLKEEVIYYIEREEGKERDKKIFEFELYFTEALLRIMYDNFGFRPYQNKLYEKIDFLFNKSDAYNINRTLSFVRRNRVAQLNFDNEKYKSWLINRIMFSIPPVIRMLPRYYNEDMIKEFDEIMKIKNFRINKKIPNNK